MRLINNHTPYFANIITYSGLFSPNWQIFIPNSPSFEFSFIFVNKEHLHLAKNLSIILPKSDGFRVIFSTIKNFIGYEILDFQVPYIEKIRCNLWEIYYQLWPLKMLNSFSRKLVELY